MITKTIYCLLASTILSMSTAVCANTYEPSIVWYHDGGKSINEKDFHYTIDEVLNTLPAGKIDGMRDLVYETFIVETRCGAVSYGYAATVNNFGIAQIRPDTAEWLMDLLYKRDRNRFSEVYKYYDPETSLSHNLLVNVPFSIAICAELYAYRLRDRSIKTLQARANAWKELYNTKHGAGTPAIYVNRVLNYS